MTVHGQFYWNKLMARDTEKAKAFYAECVGWTFDEMKMGDGPSYWIALAAGGPAGGIFPMSGPEFEGVPEHWMSTTSTRWSKRPRPMAGQSRGRPSTFRASAVLPSFRNQAAP